MFFTFKIAPVNCVSIHVSKFNGSIDNRGKNRRNSYLNRNKNIRGNIKHEILIAKKRFEKEGEGITMEENGPFSGGINRGPFEISLPFRFDSFLERIANRSVGIFYYPPSRYYLWIRFRIFTNSIGDEEFFPMEKNFARLLDSFLSKSPRKFSN